MWVGGCEGGLIFCSSSPTPTPILVSNEKTNGKNDYSVIYLLVCLFSIVQCLSCLALSICTCFTNVKTPWCTRTMPWEALAIFWAYITSIFTYSILVRFIHFALFIITQLEMMIFRTWKFNHTYRKSIIYSSAHVLSLSVSSPLRSNCIGV